LAIVGGGGVAQETMRPTGKKDKCRGEQKGEPIQRGLGGGADASYWRKSGRTERKVILVFRGAGIARGKAMGRKETGHRSEGTASVYNLKVAGKKR